MTLVTRSSCPMCEGSVAVELVSLPFDGAKLRQFLHDYFQGRVDLGLLEGGSYIVMRCNACGGMWQKEILDGPGMQKLYGEWIESSGSAKRRRNVTLTLQNARHCARLLRLLRKKDDARVLDYGMGWGEWCVMAQAFGFRTVGVELSSERVEAARKKGIDAYTPDAMPTGPYDFIYLEQVLEHVPGPHGLMEKLTGMLSPGGYIHIGVPNAAMVESFAKSDATKLLTKGPAQPLEHINMFTLVSLRLFMKQFDCVPASQREGFIRAWPLKTFVTDMILACARLLPPSVFPPGTSVLFRKSGAAHGN